MKRFLPLILGFVIVSFAAMAGYAAAPKEKQSSLSLAIMLDCDGPDDHCAEPFFTPKFHFAVEQGKWPESGVLQCQTAKDHINCGPDLVLKIERITFR